MPTIHCEVELDARPEDVFRLALDPKARKSWDPFTRAHGFMDGAGEAAVGVRSWVRARNGLRMETRYVTLDAPERVAMTMTRGPLVFRAFSGTWSFKPGANGRTRVAFRYHFALRAGLGLLLDRLVARILRREMNRRVLGLKAAAEAGQR
jgi:uncharacterized protein YndB with AHSA1/START domain